MSCYRFVVAVLTGLLLSAMASAQEGVPNTFEAGTPARAAEVNANFSSVDQRLADTLVGIDVRASTSVGSGVASASCPASHRVVSAGCGCSNEGGTRNFGVLFFCSVSGNGGLAGCFSDSGTFNSGLPSPLAEIEVTCLAVNRGDGLQPSRAASVAESEAADSALAARVEVLKSQAEAVRAKLERRQ